MVKVKKPRRQRTHLAGRILALGPLGLRRNIAKYRITGEYTIGD